MIAGAEIATLFSAIDQIDRIGNSTWLESLDSRKRADLQFHKKDRGPSFRQDACEVGDTFGKFHDKQNIAPQRDAPTIASLTGLPPTYTSYRPMPR